MEALSDAKRRKKLLPYAGISRQVQRSGLNLFQLVQFPRKTHIIIIQLKAKGHSQYREHPKHTVLHEIAPCVGINQQVQRVRFYLLNYNVVPLLMK